MLPPEAMMASWLGLPLTAVSRSMVLLKLGSVLMSMAQDTTTKGQADVYSVGCHLKPRGCLRAGLLHWNTLT